MAAAEPALAPLTIKAAVREDLIGVTGTMVEPRIKVSLFDDLLFASDIPAPQPQPDEVMAISLSSALLHSVTIRRNVGSVYDLGTGCGVQALHARRYARRVVASDVNPRALKYTEFNTALNAGLNTGVNIEASDIDLRLGSLFDPVDGERFDLVVSNPPFAVSPDHHVQYRDSGLPADEFCAELVRRAPDHIRPGGLGIILVGWGQRAGEHWSSRVRKWLPKSGFDSWLIRFHSSEPAEYAAEWNRALLDNEELHGATVQRWIDYFAHMDFETINFGVVTLRQSEGPHWIRADSVPLQIARNASDFLEQLISATDFVRGLPST
ncbi:MAG: class I SAM-dependent methyltransferase, partial [Longispora sp.]|nr:class I SAM-dependent methyltransferase [Longispora sp. (in: high G+C Gram-positive bacteria)]